MKRIAMVFLTAILCGCTDPTGLNDIDVGLPMRSVAVDTVRVTPNLRLNGGGVFVKLTGEPTARALEVLERAGLQPLGYGPDSNSLVTFPALHIATVAGRVSAGGVRRLAELRFVMRIEPSGGDTIHASELNPAKDPNARSISFASLRMTMPLGMTRLLHDLRYHGSGGTSGG
jgi:hypothetical protein